jgi:hypothetical protein
LAEDDVAVVEGDRPPSGAVWNQVNGPVWGTVIQVRDVYGDVYFGGRGSRLEIHKYGQDSVVNGHSFFPIDGLEFSPPTTKLVLAVRAATRWR